MFTVFRAILIVLTFLKYGVTGGFARVITSFVAFKVYTFLFLGIVMPILNAYIMLKVQGYVMNYVLDYVNSNIDMDAFPVVMQLTGIGAYLFTALGIDVALNMIITASTIRFALSTSLFKSKT